MIATRPSPQVRHMPPAMAEPPHPRAVEMAETLRDIAAIGGGVKPSELFQAGFSAGEVTEYFAEAERLAVELATRRVDEPGDTLAILVDKARHAFPMRQPLPPRTRESQSLTQLWGRYCAARQAYRLDRWTGQRERCQETLSDYLDKVPMHPQDRKRVLRAVAETLARVQ